MSRFGRRGCAIALAVSGVLQVGVACGGSGGRNSAFESAGEAAQAFCPLVWDFVKSVGASFNDAASDVAELDVAERRRERWEAAFAEIEHDSLSLAEQVAVWSGDALIGDLVEEIQRDVPFAIAELNDIRRLFTEHPEVDDQRHQERTQQVIVRIEKVIDLPKPDLGPFDDDDPLVLSFQAEPSCQHAVRGANDGQPRSNG